MKRVNKKKRYLVLVLSVFMIFSLSSFMLMVQAADGVEWKTIIFGQSISEANNSITLNKDNTVTITAGTKDGSAAGGKIAGSHDGISYYYTEIPSTKNFELSAKVTVNFFAKATPDNQEGFGIMARDAIGTHLDKTVFASNMVMVGGYRGLIQSVFRNNVNDVSGAGARMEDAFKFGERPANDGTATYLLKMKKTNTGYQVAVDNSPEKIYYRPKQLEVLNPGQIYLGFFAARVASITVSDITFKTSATAADPPGLPDPATAMTPSLSVLSPSTASASSYILGVTANVKGQLEIKQNGIVIYNNPLSGSEEKMINTTLITGGNTFDLSFTPDSKENVTSAVPISIQHKVTFKTYGKPGGAIYVGPKGQPAAAGTKKDPIDIYTAIQFLQPGQTIYVQGGNYNLNAPLLIEKGNDGIEGKLKVLLSYAKERPVFDFGKTSNGMVLAGSYWKIAGIDITNAASQGFRISGNHNRIELVNTYANGDTGLQISGLSTDKPAKWPSNNLILNCTSYDNRDAAENNADGFAAKLTCGEGNVFRGCIAHNNCDDGYDLYSKLETGPIGAVTIENCVAYSNGTLSDGTKTKGDGNGFKLGGEGLPVKHALRNSLAFHNLSAGVNSNSDPVIIVENTTSVDNGRENFKFYYYTNAQPQFTAKNNISFRYRTLAGAADSVPVNLLSVDNYFFSGEASVNSNGKKVSASDFKNLTLPTFKRNADGYIMSNDYMALTSKSSITGGFNIKDFSKKPKDGGK
ncbi:MAG TPA: right-handed parallel beta-helix repeat-containing protein [Bacillota bacterium]|nr:right-handed parallel beta-helix repeat-containing protein [Bacillota bacterium]